SEAVIGSEADRAQPELGFVISSFHVNVRRLLAFIAVEEKPVASYPQDGRHRFKPAAMSRTGCCSRCRGAASTGPLRASRGRCIFPDPGADGCLQRACIG